MEEARGISIAEELLKFPFVKSIYISSNFYQLQRTKKLNGKILQCN